MSGKSPRCNLLTNLALRYRETTGKFIVIKNISKCMYLGSSCLLFMNKVSFPSINAEYYSVGTRLVVDRSSPDYLEHMQDLGFVAPGDWIGTWI